MKIGIFTDSYIPYTSGVVTSITTFKEELNKLGHQIYIFAPSYPGYEDKETGVYRYFSVNNPTNPDFALAIPVYPGMNLLLNKLELDIIHVHSPFTMGLVGKHMANRHHLPLVFTYHTLYDQYAHYVPIAPEVAKEMALKFSNNFCNKCDHVVVPSNKIKNLLLSYGIVSPITVIPTGVPLHKFKGQQGNWLREKYAIPENRKILLFAGRLTKEKNLEFLVRAFGNLRKDMPDTTLVLTAQGPLENELKDLAGDLGMKLDLDIIFTGAQPFDTLVQIYYSADLFVFSSLTETQGLVLIEAMAAGLPVVAVKAFGVEDMVDSGTEGILTECNIDEFTNAIKTILSDDRLYKQYSLNALKKAESLSSRNMAIRLEEVYRQVKISSPPRQTKIQELLSRIAP
jgi:1,2-diacylglycerol 3-alpha-glucosyltransferase